MVPKGSIGKIIDYFAQNPLFTPAIKESMCMFFEVKKPKDLTKLRPSQMSSDFFNEWLIFDCELNNKRTVLEEYLFLNQNQLTREEKNFYSNIILTHHYSLYRCDAIEIGKSLKLYDVLEKKSYDVIENMATYEYVVNSYAFMRLAEINNHWEILSANGFQIPPQALPERIISDWRKRKVKFNPMVVYQSILKGLE